MEHAYYRKYNDRSLNSSKYHKLEGTPVRAILKEEARREIVDAVSNPSSSKNGRVIRKKQAKYLTDAGAMEVLLKGGKIQAVHLHQKSASPENHYYLGKDGQLKNQFGDPDGGCLFGYAGWRWGKIE